MLGRVVNLRPALLSAAACRASVLVPETLLTRHLATVASRDAFVMPSDDDVQRRMTRSAMAGLLIEAADAGCGGGLLARVRWAGWRRRSPMAACGSPAGTRC